MSRWKRGATRADPGADAGAEAGAGADAGANPRTAGSDAPSADPPTTGAFDGPELDLYDHPAVPAQAPAKEPRRIEPTVDPVVQQDDPVVDPVTIPPTAAMFTGPAFDLYDGRLTGAPAPLAPAAVAAAFGGPTRAALATDVVTCPECGQLATVDMARRQTEDFCRNCDFPLFWARGTVISPPGEQTGASLRRLPGTVGRAATASQLCPHCGEPNPPAAEICIRCTLALHPVDIPEPEPLPVLEIEPDPEPEPEPDPEPGFPWWVAVLLISLLIAVITVVVLDQLQ